MSRAILGRHEASSSSRCERDMENTSIIQFYRGTEPNHRGLYLREIQRWSDERLEAIHDYIQWLFPLPEPSAFNTNAPVLSGEVIQEFRASTDLQANLRVSFLRMMRFYGLEVHLGERITVVRSINLAVTAAGWLSPGNHNHLRITRILRCLTVLGLEPEAKAFLECLAEIYEDEQNKPIAAISDETMMYWRSAVSDAGRG